MKIKFIGAAETVTGSRTEVNSNGDLVSIDCGLFQGPKEIRQQNWQPLENAHRIKSVILTHAHIDHSGLIPLLVKQGFKGPIFCSQATAELCRILLPDAGYLQEEDAAFANRKKYSHYDPALPLFTEQDAIKSLEYLSPQPLGKWFPLAKDIRYRLSRSGHILGSTFVELGYSNYKQDRILTFSGDLGEPNSFILKEPTVISETDELVLESTYGDRVHEKGDRFEQLKKVIQKVLSRGGTLIIPAFSVGRTQEILYMIHRLETDNQIPQYDVYLDSPMALDATEIYKKYSDELKPEIAQGLLQGSLSTSRFKAVKSPDESMLLCMDSSPKIVISAAGMLNGGRVLHHLKMKLPDEKNGVLFVGYQVPGSKGFLIKNGLRKIRLHHQEVDIDCEIFSMDSLSAHADSEQIMAWLKRFTRLPQTVYLNHGEKISKETLAYRITHELGIHCELPKKNQEYSL